MMRNLGSLHTVGTVADQIKKAGRSPLCEGAKHEAMATQRDDGAVGRLVVRFGRPRLGRSLRQPNAAVRLSTQPLQRYARSHAGLLALGGLVPGTMPLHLRARLASRGSDDVLCQTILLPIRQSNQVFSPELSGAERHPAVLLLSVAVGDGATVSGKKTRRTTTGGRRE